MCGGNFFFFFSNARIKTPCYEISSRRFFHIAPVVFAIAASTHSMSHGTCFNHEITSALRETSILILP